VRWKRDFGGDEGHYWAGPSRRGVARTARSVAGRQIEIAKIDSFFSGDLPTTIGPFRPTGHNHLFIKAHSSRDVTNLLPSSDSKISSTDMDANATDDSAPPAR